MAVQNNRFAAYQRNKILTASPAELTLMLYEGAIKFCNIAITAIENKEIENAHNNIKKADRIIEEFQVTLDEKYEVSQEFKKVYDYLRRRLLMANVKKGEEGKEILNEVLEHLRTMRDTWKELMKLTNNGTKLS